MDAKPLTPEKMTGAELAWEIGVRVVNHYVPPPDRSTEADERAFELLSEASRRVRRLDAKDAALAAVLKLCDSAVLATVDGRNYLVVREQEIRAALGQQPGDSTSEAQAAPVVSDDEAQALAIIEEELHICGGDWDNGKKLRRHIHRLALLAAQADAKPADASWLATLRQLVINVQSYKHWSDCGPIEQHYRQRLDDFLRQTALGASPGDKER